ncbi:MAG: metal-dependent transcriptional regulator [Clostridia bacterium]|nr:metal-dependent transcriptional regulator [Clostridia bacterium]
MKLQESGEMYLETILILSHKSSEVHAVHVSEYMNFSRPSVSRALGILKREGYIEIHDDGHIFLTPSGKEIAEKIYERHTVLRDLLVSIGVSKETAEADACKIEHAISDETFEAVKREITK